MKFRLLDCFTNIHHQNHLKLFQNVLNNSKSLSLKTSKHYLERKWIQMSREMKDSGIEWIGKIPQDWKLSTIGQYYQERNEKVSSLEFSPLSVTKKGILPQLEHAAKSDNHENRKLVRNNDFVINSRSDRKMSSGLSHLTGSVSMINIVLYSDIMNEKYTKYLLKNYAFAEEFYRWGTGIVDDLWSTRWVKMKSIIIPVPPKSTQVSIAHELDNKLIKIDS